MVILDPLGLKGTPMCTKLDPMFLQDVISDHLNLDTMSIRMGTMFLLRMNV